MAVSLQDLIRLKLVNKAVAGSRTGFFRDSGKWMEDLVKAGLVTWVQQRGTKHRIYTITEEGRKALEENPSPAVEELRRI